MLSNTGGHSQTLSTAKYVNIYIYVCIHKITLLVVFLFVCVCFLKFNKWKCSAHAVL